ncbi:hypothetical protein K443DRAFT_9831 [Laccaria amethystina LaAM-08-1]|uniref:Uncharacterized protein n=1 Tax=Laccaria amethystina LaAM-08-1 TaxID=1095629 RepID=A0A0C9WXT2_9AGAR|nr:hypothetical protein K443DRAFT_9831 [Laccaria amethystina LaAM-08-1]
MSKFLEWRISTQLRLPLPTQQSLAYDDVEHPPGVGLPSYARLLPTANPSFVNPKRSTSPPPLPVYQRATVRWRSCMLRCLYARPPPSLMARVRQFTIPPPTKAPPIPIVASPPSVYQWGTNVEPKGVIGSHSPGVTPVHDHPPHRPTFLLRQKGVLRVVHRAKGRTLATQGKSSPWPRPAHAIQPQTPPPVDTHRDHANPTVSGIQVEAQYVLRLS